MHVLNLLIFVYKSFNVRTRNIFYKLCFIFNIV
nr:MAG TPA: hypothetical protein [Caudoviricetes sp.]